MSRHIIACGLTQAEAGFRFWRPPGTMSVVMGCGSGSGVALVAGSWRRFQPGMAYLMPAVAIHAYAVDRAPWTLAWVCFLESPDHDPLIGGTGGLLVRRDPGPLTTAIGQLHQESMGPGDPGVLSHLVAAVDVFARRLAAPLEAIPPSTLLAQVWKAVEEDPARRWRLADLARLAGIGPETLRMRCQAESARSPMGQVTWIRMGIAVQMLDDHGMTVAAVAGRVGYDDAFAFSTAFKRCLGMSPATYRAQRRGHVRVG